MADIPKDLISCDSSVHFKSNQSGVSFLDFETRAADDLCFLFFFKGFFWENLSGELDCVVMAHTKSRTTTKFSSHTIKLHMLQVRISSHLLVDLFVTAWVSISMIKTRRIWDLVVGAHLFSSFYFCKFLLALVAFIGHIGRWVARERERRKTCREGHQAGNQTSDSCCSLHICLDRVSGPY